MASTSNRIWHCSCVDYARAGIPEDYLVWGPANLIYYPEFAPITPTYLDLSAVILNKGNSLSIIEERDLGTHERRGIYSELDLSKTLIISMPTRGSCVHIINGDHIELSEEESEEIHIIAASSKIDQILIEENPHIPDTNIFGKEPIHNWCYYYEKASLARQRGNWEEIIILGEEVQRQRLHPIDWVEWMPFLQAYAYMGEIEKARALVTIIKEKHFLQFQACNLFSNDDVDEIYMDGHLFLRDIFCH